jgi:uncharacterized membrane protein YebE (DUF533 family)
VRTLSDLVAPRGPAAGERLVRALAWLAWADGELHPGEAEVLKRLVEAFPFDDEQRARVAAEIQRPAPVGALLSEITEPAEKRLLLALCQFVSARDDRQTHEEVVAVAQVAGAIGFVGKEAQAVIKLADGLARAVSAGTTSLERALVDLVSEIEGDA